ncbi:hypothetical protein EMIHUDRAFT_456107 [Emiliania huxleyi CCMP1516]|uniref:Uncharacterized protein n=2 Tax=Emiliania huxleyi TaxID=2903 RepID=A0A0D3K9G7_EMIH1|nr:hypothetical protein EMIHUDRAFT_456107 [Emiliania huxleyi CCMP1516]EOD32402.1 hypothetical protein EMIHUDRAFT_456107 [Emiliania huxleyi CCMP1516]|eukprot:XP_005784831.1 hypothetical protein EMIHUDRAFT_456107 [Emiliania huxleyi CCMP1516]
MVRGKDKPNMRRLPRTVGARQATVRMEGLPDDLDCMSANNASDSAAIGRFIVSQSLGQSADAKRCFAAELRRPEVAPSGGWCCKSSSLWCAGCGHNFLWSGADEHVADNIPLLLGLPKSTAPCERRLPGELEAALCLVDRVSRRLKPLGFVVLDNLSQQEGDLVRSEVQQTGTLIAVEYRSAYGMSLLGFCLRGRRVGEIVSLEGLGDFYTRAGLPGVAAEVHAWHSVRRSPAMGPEAMISRYVKSFDVEDTQMGWLTGILLGYPLWTTAARYHSGALTLRPADRRGGEAACEAEEAVAGRQGRVS